MAGNQLDEWIERQRVAAGHPKDDGICPLCGGENQTWQRTCRPCWNRMNEAAALASMGERYGR